MVQSSRVKSMELKLNFLGVRHYQCFLWFLATSIAFGMRANLSVGIVAMTRNNTSSGAKGHPEWTNQKQLMISSFFIGYLFLQVIAGQLAEKFGPKLFLCLAMGINSIFSGLLPILGEELGYLGVVLSRFLQGLTQGFLYPSIQHLLSKWSPYQERTRMSAFVFSGASLGTAFSNVLTGIISDSSWGWPGAFYLSSIIGLAWVVLFAFFGSNTPETSSKISATERTYIESGNTFPNNTKTPWKSILMSLPLWAILISNFGQSWGFYTLLSETPIFLNSIFQMNDTQNGIISAGPYLVTFATSIIFSFLADYLIENKVTSVIFTRKLFNSVGSFLPCLSLVLLGSLDQTQKTLAISLIFLTVISNSCVTCGFLANYIDISPNFCGTLMGITNGLSTLASILAPLALDWYSSFGYEETSMALWQIVFYVTTAIYFLSGTFYACFASAQVQSWNHKPNE